MRNHFRIRTSCDSDVAKGIEVIDREIQLFREELTNEWQARCRSTEENKGRSTTTLLASPEGNRPHDFRMEARQRVAHHFGNSSDLWIFMISVSAAQSYKTVGNLALVSLTEVSSELLGDGASDISTSDFDSSNEKLSALHENHVCRS